MSVAIAMNQTNLCGGRYSLGIAFRYGGSTTATYRSSNRRI